MNYYERYCGDYSRDTAHLSLGEHGAYTLMLDFYYSTEKALPSDYTPIYRLCRAMSKAEQTHVRSVADEFFPIAEDGLRHNARADRDIAKALKRIDAVRTNGAKGGRPKKNLVGFKNGIYEEPSRLSNANLLGCLPETYPGEASPDPRPQALPSQKTKAGGKTPALRSLPADFGISDSVRTWAADKGHTGLDARLEHFVGYAKRSGKRYADWDAAFMSAVREDWAKINGSAAASHDDWRKAL